MTLPDLTSDDTIRRLAAGQLKWPTARWKSRCGASSNYKELCRELCGNLDLKSKIIWDDYGSGYASYIDAWFYRDAPAFKVSSTLGPEHKYRGIWILLHKSMPYYVLGQGEKSWRANSGSSYLPSAQDVDKFSSGTFIELGDEIERFLSDRGHIRLYANEIRRPIPKDILIETLLSDGDFCLFDALFHWTD